MLGLPAVVTFRGISLTRRPRICLRAPKSVCTGVALSKRLITPQLTLLLGLDALQQVFLFPDSFLIASSCALRRNFLVWPHGAFHAQVAGDVVGSWFPATSMRKVTNADSELWDLNPGDWVLPLPDIEPGVHRYVGWALPCCCCLQRSVLLQEGSSRKLLTHTLPLRCAGTST